jgi:hypothetical protein
VAIHIKNIIRSLFPRVTLGISVSPRVTLGRVLEERALRSGV